MEESYSEPELEAMMVDLESDRVERKESLQGDSPARVREAVCAFANDLPDHRRAGVVFVGADDEGRPKGYRDHGRAVAAARRTAVDFTTGLVETRRSTWPLGALQQLVRNAIMHRTYEGTNAPVRVYWFDDRIEIISPGGPYGAVTADTFGQPGVVDYRNPILAEAMRVLGLVQRYGFGIPAARRELRANGQPEPDFDVGANSVHCTVRARA